MKTDRSPGNGLIPVPIAVAALAGAASRVCRIVFDRGTRRERTVACGFLVGVDLVMTSAHVWPSVVAGTTLPSGVALVFEDGTTATLAADWLSVLAPGGADLAIVRVVPMPPDRGWIELPRRTPSLAPEMIVVVVQFPRPAPAPSLSFGSIRRVDAANGRLFYTAPTIRGSSGAPVLTAAMQLVAVHRSASRERTNEGVIVPKNLVP